jgi:HEAT repeat protein
MVFIKDPVTEWAFFVLISVMLGTGLLIAVAIFRRWTQIRYSRYVHSLQRQHRPALAKVLSGALSPSVLAGLHESPLPELELLLDPLFSKRRLPERCLVFLEALCVDLGLIKLWQARLASAWSASSPAAGNGYHKILPGPKGLRYLLRAKSIRNLGTLRHQSSWPLLVKALNDRHPDIQMVTLRSLAQLGAPASFPVLRERLHAVIQGKTSFPPLQAIQAAMASFALACVPSLLPSLRHQNQDIRLHGSEILRTMVCREAGRQPDLILTQELLTPPLLELLLSALAVDTCPEIRARAAEVIIYISHPGTAPALRNLLLDERWFVRLRTVRALAHRRQVAAPLHHDIRECLRDPHWRVREAAIHTLITLGPEGKHQLYEHFLSTPDRPLRNQIVEVIERRGLMSTLLEEYSAGTDGSAARFVEQLASDAAPLGLSGVLRTLDPAVRERFLHRFVPTVQSRTQPLEKNALAEEIERHAAKILPPPHCQAA